MLGAIIGDIVGSTLELSNIILSIADDLYTSCIINELDPIDTPEKFSGISVIVRKNLQD